MKDQNSFEEIVEESAPNSNRHLLTSKKPSLVECAPMPTEQAEIQDLPEIPTSVQAQPMKRKRVRDNRIVPEIFTRGGHPSG